MPSPERSGCGFSFGNGCSGGSNSAVNLFGGKPTNRRDVIRSSDPGVSAMNDHSQLFRLLACYSTIHAPGAETSACVADPHLQNCRKL